MYLEKNVKYTGQIKFTITCQYSIDNCHTYIENKNKLKIKICKKKEICVRELACINCGIGYKYVIHYLNLWSLCSLMKQGLGFGVGNERQFAVVEVNNTLIVTEDTICCLRPP